MRAACRCRFRRHFSTSRFTTQKRAHCITGEALTYQYALLITTKIQKISSRSFDGLLITTNLGYSSSRSSFERHLRFILPPDWKSAIAKLVSRVSEADVFDELQSHAKHAQKNYDYWDVVRQYPRKLVAADETWAYIKIARQASLVETSVLAEDGKPFLYNSVDELHRRLHYIDTQAAGLLETHSASRPSEAYSQELVLRGLTEEAIASSQIEGASTTRAAAKKMLATKRKPRTVDEQMILNNYVAMERIIQWADAPLTLEMLLELQRVLLTGTDSDQSIIGRLRTDSDTVEVSDMDRDNVFIPPKEKFYRPELERLLEYANDRLEDERFIHPVLKATILHFWFAYLHPFADGNGRTARALFYWYLLRHKYWMIRWISVSQYIKVARGQYDRAYLETEHDDNDLTYFLLFITKMTVRAVDEMRKEMDKLFHEQELVGVLQTRFSQFTRRQIALLLYIDRKKPREVTIEEHRARHGTSYESARSDLLGLEKYGLLMKRVEGKKYVFQPVLPAIEALMTGARAA
jgi:Fic family protein